MGQANRDFVDARSPAQRLFDGASAQRTVQPSDTRADSSSARSFGRFFAPKTLGRFNGRCGTHNDTSISSRYLVAGLLDARAYSLLRRTVWIEHHANLYGSMIG